MRNNRHAGLQLLHYSCRIRSRPFSTRPSRTGSWLCSMTARRMARPTSYGRFVDRRIHLVVGQANRGHAARLNEIVQQNRSALFARMDGDDIAYPDRLQRQVVFLQNRPEVDLVAGAIAVFDNDGEAIGVRRGPLEHEQICAHPISGFPMAHPTWLGRADWFRRHPYREDAVHMEDWALLFRACGRSRFANLHEVVLGYREASLSLRKLALWRWYRSRFIVEFARTDRNYISALSEVGREGAKFMLDAFALGTGLNHRVLRHRAPPISRSETDEWRAVKQAVSAAAQFYTKERECVPA